jgi:hypothetical protein
MSSLEKSNASSIVIPTSLKNVKLKDLRATHHRRENQPEEGPRPRILIANFRGDKCAKAIEEFKARRPATAPIPIPQNQSPRRVSLKIPENMVKWKKKPRRRPSIRPHSSRNSIISLRSSNTGENDSLPELAFKKRPSTAPSILFTTPKPRLAQLKTVQSISEKFKARGIPISARTLQRAILDPEEIVHTVVHASTKRERKKNVKLEYTAWGTIMKDQETDSDSSDISSDSFDLYEDKMLKRREEEEGAALAKILKTAAEKRKISEKTPAIFQTRKQSINPIDENATMPKASQEAPNSAAARRASVFQIIKASEYIVDDLPSTITDKVDDIEEVAEVKARVTSRWRPQGTGSLFLSV